jgi:phenylacetate-CoA ligase
MKELLEKLYYRSPVVLQNAAVSLYGLHLRRQRYAPSARAHLNALLKSERYSDEAMGRFLDERFTALVAHAIETVPFWREWSAEAGAGPGDFTRLDDLAHLPVIRKEDIKKRPDRYLSESYGPKARLLALSTSGTSGTPLTIYCDRDVRSHHYAFFSRLRGWFGVTVGARRATLFGRIMLSAEVKTPPFWRYDAAQHNLLMSSYHLAQENLRHYHAKLQDYSPDEVIGYPSSVYQIARYIIESDSARLRPRVVFTTAETLLAHQRDVIERAFDCPVIDQYGCTEMAFFVSQCEEGSIHVHPEHGWLEALDESAKEVPVGQRGRCVATGLINPVMPLLRYDIGDIIVKGHGRCACGRAFPVVDRIEGREDDVLTTPDGRPLGRMDPIFKGRLGIVECQIVQIEPAFLEFRIVPGEGYDDRAEQDLIREARKRTGGEMEIRVLVVPEIPRGASGKFKAVVRAF